MEWEACGAVREGGGGGGVFRGDRQTENLSSPEEATHKLNTARIN